MSKRVKWYSLKSWLYYLVFDFKYTLPLGIIAFLAIFGTWIYVYRNTSELVTFTVDQRERVTKSYGDSVASYYLVWSCEGEVFSVVDSLPFLTWNSSDRYGQLKEGTNVTAKVAGWRIPFLSAYRNVVEVQSVNGTAKKWCQYPNP